MARIILAWENRDNTLSGGDWEVSLPLNNLHDTNLSKKARTDGLGTADTQFNVDLGSSLAVRVFALVATNLTVDSKYRLRGSDDNTFATSVYDTGWVDVYPAIFSLGTGYWGEDAVWTGKPRQKQIDRYTKNLIHVTPSDKFARYWRVELDDPTNADGYIDLGRLFIGRAWQPARNYTAGAPLVWDTRTTVDETLSGRKIFAERDPIRRFSFDLDQLTTREGYECALELSRVADISGEVLVIPDYEDTVNIFRTAFLGHLAKKAPFIRTDFNLGRMSFELEEIR